MKRINNKGFTMIELVAVILIMGVVTMISIPTYQSIINKSKRTAYADAALYYIRNAKTKIANKEIDKVFNENVTYYIDIKFLTEDGTPVQSPFGEWVEAYVIYIIDDHGRTKFYFLSLDEQGWMIKREEEKNIDRTVVVRDQKYESVDIENIESRDTIMMVDADGDMYETPEIKAWTREQTKACFSFRDLNANEVSLTYYNVSCLGADGSVVIPAKVGGKKVTEIYEYTFHAMGIKSVSIPEGVKTIGTSAFANNQLTNVRIPSSVTSISSSAFASNQISNLKMSASVSYIGARAFQYNKIDKPLRVVVPNENATIGSCAFCNNFMPSASFLFSGSTVRGYVGDLSEFAVDKVFRVPAFNNDGVPITEIASGAFTRMSLGGYTIDIPEGIVTIGSEAFSFGGISAVRFPSTLKTIGSHAFYSNRLTVLNIPDSVVSISSTAFNNNLVSNTNEAWIYKRTELGIDYTTIIGYAGAQKNNLTIPASRGGKNLTKFGHAAFAYLGLTGTLSIPSTVTTYEGTQVFAYNSLTKVDNGDGVYTDGFIYARNADGSVNKEKLYAYVGASKNPVIPSEVKEIGENAFYYTYINSVKMPEELTKIGAYAFYVCQLKGTVTIPSKVTYIGTNAFYKAINWTSMNGDLTKIVNKTGKAFNWHTITGGPTPAAFATGTVENWYGNIEVTAS